jgi:UDP:flavonoid glycosyltransferase YjiC (YdhE family)
MKILLYISGTRGDIQPIAALADYLRKKGDQIVFCCPPNGKFIASRYDIPAHIFGQDVEEVSAATPDPSRFPVRATTALIRYLKTEISEQFAVLPSLAKDSDLIITATFGFGVRNIAEFLNKPFIYIAYSPSIMPSGYYPPMTIRRRINSLWLNRFLFKLTDSGFTLAFQKQINRERARLKMHSIAHFWDYSIGTNILLACDPEITPAAPDTSERCIQTGYLLKPISTNLDERLAEFLDTKGPFIYAGFGSMKSHLPEETARILFEAADISGFRLIMTRGWKGIELEKESEKHFFADDIPHHLLFPRVSAVIHHGGAGTIATAARAGIPQIIIPHMTDQFFNGYQVHDRGLGPEPIWRSRLSSSNLAKTIKETFHNPGYKKTAEEIAVTLSNRDSFSEAAGAIRELFKRQITRV